MAGPDPYSSMALPLRPMSHVVVAELVANVLSVEVVAGQQVEATQAVVVLESMKMEITVHAPRDGHIEKLLCAAGQPVAAGQPLALLR